MCNTIHYNTSYMYNTYIIQCIIYKLFLETMFHDVHMFNQQGVYDKWMFLKNKNLFIYSAVLGLSCGMWDLVPQPGIEPRIPALGAWSLSHWTTSEVPRLMFDALMTGLLQA